VVAHKPLLQNLDDGNAAGHRRLEINRHATLLRQGKELLPPFGEQRLVPGDDDFLRPQRGGHHFIRGGGAADQLHHHGDGRVIDEVPPVSRQQIGRHLHIARAGQIAHGDALDPQFRAGALADEGAVLFKILEHTRAHVA